MHERGFHTITLGCKLNQFDGAAIEGELIRRGFFAEPDRAPLYPQLYAEIMGGRIPLGVNQSAMPTSLAQCRLGRLTAEEIGLLDLTGP